MEISEFCLKLETKPENLTQVAELTMAQEYDKLREKVLIYAPDKFSILPSPVIIKTEYDSPKTHAKNIDLLTFAYGLQTWLKTNCGELDTQALQAKIRALRSWQDVAAQSDKDILTFLRENFPQLELDSGMPVENVRKAFSALMSEIKNPAEALILKRPKEVSPSVLAKMALEKLSGDLSYDNIATAKQILKRIT